MQQLGLCPGVSGVAGDADAGGHGDVQVRFFQPNRLPNQLVQAPSDTESVFLRRLREQNHEFVPSITERQVDETALVFDGLPDLSKELRSHQVPVRVVHILEMIEIDENQ